MKKIIPIILLLAFIAICFIIPAVLPTWFTHGIMLILLLSILALEGTKFKELHNDNK